MAKLIEITGKALSGEWGTDDEIGNGIPVLRTTNFTNEGFIDYRDVVTRHIDKKNIDEKYLRPGDIIIEKSGGSDKQPVGRVVYFEGPESTYMFNNFTGLLRVKEQKKWFPKYIFYSLYYNYYKGGTKIYENKTTGLHNLKMDSYISRYDVLEKDYGEQIRICERIDKINRLIQLHKEEIIELEKITKSRFVELFVGKNYDIVKAGSIIKEMRNGVSPSTSGGHFEKVLTLSAITQGKFDDKAWRTKPLLDMGNCKNGMNFHYDDCGVEINCLGVGDFKDLSVIDDTKQLPTVSLNGMPSEEYLLKDNDHCIWFVQMAIKN